MSAPNVDATVAQWALLFHGARGEPRFRTPGQWSRILRCVAEADTRLTRRDPTRSRGDAQWCRDALDLHARLTRVGAYRDRDQYPTLGWTPNARLVRQWLAAPAVLDGELPRTMLQVIGLDVEFGRNRLADPAVVKLLVEHLQELGLYGIPGHRVDLWSYYGDGSMPPHTYVMTITTPDGHGRASLPLYLGEHLERGLPPTDLLIRLLTGVGERAEQLLPAPTRSEEHHPRLPPGVDGHPIGMRHGRPFPPLSIDDTPVPSRPADQGPSATPHRHRRS
jgi:hypothetical protein